MMNPTLEAAARECEALSARYDYSTERGSMQRQYALREAAERIRALAPPATQVTEDEAREVLDSIAAPGYVDRPDAIAAMLTFAARASSERERRLVAVLEWYAEQVAGCRKIGSVGDPSRHALDHDGGNRARAALGGTDAE